MTLSRAKAETVENRSLTMALIADRTCDPQLRKEYGELVGQLFEQVAEDNEVEDTWEAVQKLPGATELSREAEQKFQEVFTFLGTFHGRQLTYLRRHTAR